MSRIHVFMFCFQANKGEGGAGRDLILCLYFFKLPLAQNNPYARVENFGVTYSEPLHG